MKREMKIFIIAGEVSGDVLGAKIMEELSDVHFAGVGGEHMRAKGLKSLFSISNLSVMGLAEVIFHAGNLLARINQTAEAIEKFNPDIVLTIDSPSFAKRVVKIVKLRAEFTGKKLPLFYHVVAPQVWAWGKHRAKKFAKIFDKLYCFFDFERPYFEKYGLKTIVTGHPIADGLRPEKIPTGKQKVITLIPGSRMSEAKKLMPVFKVVAKRLAREDPDFEFVIPVVETTRNYIKSEIQSWRVPCQIASASTRYKWYKRTYVAVAASGTVSVELAIMHVPAVIVYKMNWFTMLLGRILIRVKWASLVNILLNKGVYPELLGNAAKPKNIIRWVHRLSVSSRRKQMISELSRADKLWQPGGQSAAVLIANDIKSKTGHLDG